MLIAYTLGKFLLLLDDQGKAFEVDRDRLCGLGDVKHGFEEEGWRGGMGFTNSSLPAMILRGPSPAYLSDCPVQQEADHDAGRKDRVGQPDGASRHRQKTHHGAYLVVVCSRIHSARLERERIRV